jgi:hypothetical protein
MHPGDMNAAPRLLHDANDAKGADVAFLLGQSKVAGKLRI